MSYFSGSDGCLYFNTSIQNATPPFGDAENGRWRKAGRIQEWSMTSTMQTLDATGLGDYDKRIYAGIRSATGTLRLFYYTGSDPAPTFDSSPANNDASWFWNVMCRPVFGPGKNEGLNLHTYTATRESPRVRLKLAMKEDYGASDALEFFGYLTSAAVGVRVNELVMVDCTFEVDQGVQISTF